MEHKTDETPGEYETKQDKVKVEDKSNDRKYFTVTPRLVWALCDSPYEYTLWCVIKDIAGEEGECILSREDMAVLGMMSTGMVSKCREKLIGKGLLQGESRRDPGYPQSVWHLRIPDFWEENIRWSKAYPKLKARVEYKYEQWRLRQPSPGDGVEESSPGDGGRIPGDGGRIPGDGKNIVLEKPLEEIWNLIQDSLKKQMEMGPFHKYVELAYPVSLVDGVLTIAEPNQDAFEWAEDRLTTRIERFLVGILHTDDPRVEFVVAIQEAV